MAILAYSGELAPLASERQAKTVARAILSDRLCRPIGSPDSGGRAANVRRATSRSASRTPGGFNCQRSTRRIKRH
jgi:hypothetical protein